MSDKKQKNIGLIVIVAGSWMGAAVMLFVMYDMMHSMRSMHNNMADMSTDMKTMSQDIRTMNRSMANMGSNIEQMNQNNIRKSLTDTFAMGSEILARAKDEKVEIHAYIAVAFECPYEGKVDSSFVIDRVGELMSNEPGRLVIADTIGAANPNDVKLMMAELIAQHGTQQLGCHFHDTRAIGLAKVFAALDPGIRHFDRSAGGFGGCPFAPGARGNVATEDVVLLCESAGLSTGINIEALLASVKCLSQIIGSPQGGRSHTWLSDNWQTIAH